VLREDPPPLRDRFACGAPDARMKIRSPIPAAALAFMSLTLSPRMAQRAGSSPKSDTACKIIPGLGFRHGDHDDNRQCRREGDRGSDTFEQLTCPPRRKGATMLVASNIRMARFRRDKARRS
jgi:hypothetical protein